ncbi:MAG: C39 family peptidase [Chloroflexota bacterium]|mgnify:CR=1 FL=1
MRDAKKRKALNTRQMAILETLLIANVLIVVVAAFPAFSDWLPTFSHRSTPNGVMMIVVNSAATSLPAATSTPTAILTQTPTQNSPVVPSNTPTSVIPGLSATPPPNPLYPLPPDVHAVQLDVVGRPQTLPLSCEARSAVDWAGYFGFNIDEIEFFGRLPLSDNPDVGFAGDVNGRWGQTPPNAYGVHAEPVAALLREYGVNAQARRELRWEDVHSEIAAGRPVLAWVVGHVWSRTHPVEYTASDDAKVIVAPYEHTVIVVGYDDENVFILDGSRVYLRERRKFLSSWAALGNMAIIAGP